MTVLKKSHFAALKGCCAVQKIVIEIVIEIVIACSTVQKIVIEKNIDF